MNSDVDAEITAGWILLILSSLAWVIAWVMEYREQRKYRNEQWQRGLPDQWRQRNRMSRENVRMPR
jgi:hypothetical protein